MRVFSYGGGVQSTAALVLAAQGQLAVDAFLFANVGDDSEHPATLRYVQEVALPYAQAHGIRLEELQRIRKDGTPETLYGRIMRPGSRSVPIPVRVTNGAPGNRSCTADFKIKVINSWLYKRGARKTKPATVLLGISLDEWHRMKDSHVSYVVNAYPLIERRMSRQDCINVIERAGLAMPPKSSCYFCPFHRLSTWQAMRDNEPELFDKAVALEKHINGIRQRIGKDAVYFTTKGKPLPMAVGDASQPSLFAGAFEDDACESGYCVA